MTRWSGSSCTTKWPSIWTFPSGRSKAASTTRFPKEPSSREVTSWWWRFRPRRFRPTAATPAHLGPYTGRLSNGGEELRLVNNDGRVMNVVDYRDGGAWPVVPDGSGASLAKRDPTSASEPAENWTPSPEVGGTPGA